MNSGPRINAWREVYGEALGAVYSENLEHAERLFERCVALGPDSWEPYYGLAWAILQRDEPTQNDLERAEANLRKALELGGAECGDAAALLGRILLDQGNPDQAFLFFLRAMGRSSHTEDVENGLVDSLSRLLNELENGSAVEESVAACTRLENLLTAASLPGPILHSLVAEVTATRATCYTRLADNRKAEADWRKVLQLTPSHPLVPEVIRKSSMKSGSGDLKSTSDPTFEEVGGHNVAKTYQAQLRKLFETYFSRGDVEATRKKLEEYGQVPTRAFLLFGPSGCGKTYVIRAFSGEYRHRHGLELPIHRLRLDQVMNKWVGESEKAITRLFDDAIRTQPSVLFADEIDAIGLSRDGGQDWRISQTAHLLQEVDRLHAEGAFVIFFGCTNRIWSVDMALLRRFDQLIPVELPGPEVRKQIFLVHLNRLGPRVRPVSLDLDKLAAASHGLTPGDIAKVVRKSIDTLFADQAENGDSVPLDNQRIEASLSEYHNPIHLKRWVRESLRGLRAAGHADMAADVTRIYGPYVDEIESEGDSRDLRPIPSEAWTERQSYHSSLINRARGSTS